MASAPALAPAPASAGTSPSPPPPPAAPIAEGASGGGGSTPYDNTHYLFVPGRVCLMGEHSDWAGGFRRFDKGIAPGCTLVCGTNHGLHAEVKAHPSSLVLRSTREDGTDVGPVEIPMEAGALLRAAREGGFFSYAAGVAYMYLTRFRVAGLSVHNHRTDLPLKKGLSSSAAVCVMVARAYNLVYRLKQTVRGEMECAYQGELLTPSMCGRMDQCCAFGSRPVMMTFDGEFLDTEPITVPRPLYLVIGDLNAKKDTVVILRDLQKCYPVPSNDDERRLHKVLGELNLDITRRARAALEAGDAAALGALMTEAQSHFDEAGMAVCPSQLTAPVLHKALAHEGLKPFVYGGKGIGAGGDGSVQFVCRSYEAQEAAARVLEDELGMPALKLTIEAASTVRKAVVVAAGYSPQLFPASKTTHAPLFPIVDSAGVARPAILLIVDELVAAGLEEVIIVVAEGDEHLYRALFKDPLPPQQFHALKPAQRDLAKHILEVGERVTLVCQRIQDGFGHAVLTAREAVGDESFLLVLGDHLYRAGQRGSTAAGDGLRTAAAAGRSDSGSGGFSGSRSGAAAPRVSMSAGRGTGRSCVQQVLDTYVKSCVDGAALVGLFESDVAGVGAFGTVTGTWLQGGPAFDSGEAASGSGEASSGSGDGSGDDGPDGGARGGASTPTAGSLPLIKVTRLVEKPTPAFAAAELATPGMPPDRMLTVFGMYVLPSQVFSELARDVEHNLRDEAGTIAFTGVLDRVRAAQGLRGVVVDGERFDLGTPAHFIDSVAGFARE